VRSVVHPEQVEPGKTLTRVQLSAGTTDNGFKHMIYLRRLCLNNDVI